MPQYLWLATGGKSQFNSRLTVLKGRKIIAFPDIDTYHDRLRPAIYSSSPAPIGDLMPNIILISLHLNAAGDGTKWMNAIGWSCYTYKGQTESVRLENKPSSTLMLKV